MLEIDFKISFPETYSIIPNVQIKNNQQNDFTDALRLSSETMPEVNFETSRTNEINPNFQLMNDRQDDETHTGTASSLLVSLEPVTESKFEVPNSPLNAITSNVQTIMMSKKRMNTKYFKNVI